MEYSIYILSREVEINGVVSDASPMVENLKNDTGCFENTQIGV